MLILRGLMGLAFFVALAWLMSSDRKRFPTRVVLGGLLMQLTLAWFCLKTTVGVSVFEAIAGKSASDPSALDIPAPPAGTTDVTGWTVG